MSDIAPAVPGSRRGKGCLFGCSIGCLVVLALLGAAVYVGFRFYGEFMRKFESEGYDRVEGQVIEVKPPITRTYSLEEAAQALRDVMERRVKGKVAILPRG